MANGLKMAKVQSILSLYAKGWSQRRIARELGVDRGAVARHVRRAAQAAQAHLPVAGAEGEGAAPNPANAPIGSGSNPANAPIGSGSNLNRLARSWEK